MKKETVIELKELKKVYGTGESGVTALDGVSLEIRKGEIFGIIGLSGAGKSTLVRCINLLEKPTSGSVRVNGVELTELGDKELREQRRKIGMIFQDFNLLSQRNVLDNVSFPLELGKLSKHAAKERATELLREVGLEDKAKAYPSQLSGGQQQRVAIARALASSPDVLLCDEATSALDPGTTLQILELLKRINKEKGVTVVVITHEMKVIETVCDRVAILADSKVAECGEVREIFRHPSSEAAKRLIFPGTNRSNGKAGKGKLLRLVFDGSADKPIVSNMVLSCGEPVNILAADTKNLEGRIFGQMLIQLPEDSAAEQRMLSYLDGEKIHYTEETNGAI